MTDQQTPRDDELLDAWYETLRGKGPSGPAQPAVERARRLRTRILAEHEEQQQGISDAELTRLREKMLFRLSREGLLNERNNAGSTVKRRWPVPMALAASIAALGIAVLLVLQNTGPLTSSEGQILAAYGELEVMRGDIPQRDLRLEEAEATARGLGDRLTRLGVPFVLRRGTTPGSLAMTIQLEGVAARQEARDELAALGVDASTDQVVLVLFAPAR